METLFSDISPKMKMNFFSKYKSAWQKFNHLIITAQESFWLSSKSYPTYP